MTSASTTRLIGALRSFVEGLTAWSLGSALGAIGFAAAEIVLAFALVTPRNIARLDARYLKESRNDDLAEVTAAALRLKYSRTGRRGVVYLGASNANRAVFAHGRHLQHEISEAAGERIDFYRLSADNEKMGEWLVILDQLPRSFRGVAVLSVCDEAGRFANRATGTKLALSSPTLEHPPPVFRRRLPDALLSPDQSTGIYFLDHLRFFASRRSVLARLGPAALRGKVTHGARKGAAYWRKKQRRRSREGGPPLLSLFPQLERIVASLEARGVEVVLVEAPINPRYDSMKPLRQSRRLVYEPAMFDLAERLGAHYWNPSVVAGLGPDDFRDAIHLRDWDAERRWEADLVERLGRLLRGEPVEDGPETPDFGSRSVADADGDEEQ